MSKSTLELKRERASNEPNNASAQFALAVALIDKESYDEALPLFIKTIELNPNHKEAFMYLVHVSRIMGNHDPAIQCLEKLIQKEDNALCYCYLGIIFKNKKEPFKAAPLLEKAIEIDDLNLKALKNLGIVYLQLNQIDKALNMFEEVLDLYPEDPDANSYKSLVYYHRGDYVTALSIAKQNIEQDPSSSVSYFTLGLTSQANGEYKEAALNFERSIESDALLLEAYDALGVLYYRDMKNLEGALKIFSKLKQVEPNYTFQHDYFEKAQDELKKISEQSTATSQEEILQNEDCI